MNSIIPVISIVLLVFSSFCISAEIVGGPPEQYVITINSPYGYEKLTFTQNIYDSYQIPVYPDAVTLRDLIKESNPIHIIFKDSLDNACSSVATFNIVYKVRRYYNYQGDPKDFFTFESLEAPQDDTTTIILLGPRSGAQTDQVTITDNKIYVEGVTLDGKHCIGLERAADKLILSALDLQLS